MFALTARYAYEPTTKEKIMKAGENPIQPALALLFRRIDVNALLFGMSSEEVEMIKQDCKIAYQHKIILDKIQMKRSIEE